MSWPPFLAFPDSAILSVSRTRKSGVDLRGGASVHLCEGAPRPPAGTKRFTAEKQAFSAGSTPLCKAIACSIHEPIS